MSIIAFLKEIHTWSSNSHNRGSCRTGCCNRANLQTGLPQGTSKECTCQGWHTSRGGILPPPPTKKNKNTNDNISLQWLQIFSCPNRQQRRQSQCCPHAVQETRANTCIQLVVMEICLNRHVYRISFQRTWLKNGRGSRGCGWSSGWWKGQTAATTISKEDWKHFQCWTKNFVLKHSHLFLMN